MTRPSRKLVGGAFGAYQSTETVSLDSVVVSHGNTAATFAAAMVTNFQSGPQQEVTLTDDVSGWTTSNRVLGASVRIYVNPGSSTRTLAFSSSWVFVGAKPTNIAANKLGVLVLTVRDASAETGIVAAWAVQA